MFLFWIKKYRAGVCCQAKPCALQRLKSKEAGGTPGKQGSRNEQLLESCEVWSEVSVIGGWVAVFAFSSRDATWSPGIDSGIEFDFWPAGLLAELSKELLLGVLWETSLTRGHPAA